MENRNDLFETSLIAGLIVLAGDLVCGQGVVVMMTGLTAASGLGLLAAYRLIKGDKGGSKTAGAKALIFAGMILVALGIDAANKAIARSRAETIIAACRSYKDRTGAYPETLQTLVPEYLKAVPRARYSVLWSAFHYGEGRLAWMVVPMTVMPSYDLNTGNWSFAAREALPAVLGRHKS